MPATRRRLRRSPAPKDFGAIGLGERMRWISGTILIEGEGTPGPYTQGPPLPCWESWGEWAAVYAAVREDFLAWCALRPRDHPPYAELRFAAYLRGNAPGAVVIDRGPDPRRVLAGQPLRGSV